MGKRRGEKPSGWTVTTASMPGPALLGPTVHTISMEMLAGRWVRCLELLGRYVGVTLGSLWESLWSHFPGTLGSLWESLSGHAAMNIDHPNAHKPVDNFTPRPQSCLKGR